MPTYARADTARRTGALDRAKHRGPVRPRLGELLVERRIVSVETLDRTLATRPPGQRLGEALQATGAVDPERLAQTLAHHLRLQYRAPPLAPDRAAVKLIRAELARRRGVLPLKLDGRAVLVAMVDPLDHEAVAELQFHLGRRVEPVVVSPQALADAFTSALGGALSDLLERVPTEAPLGEAEARTLERQARAAPVVQLVDHILTEAIELGASDIHVQEEEDVLLVRFRRDGVLSTAMELPTESGSAVLSRVKVMAGMDIAEKRRPQDGGFRLRHRRGRLTFRVSTLPAERGEKAVLRLLNPIDTPDGLGSLGLSDRDVGALRRMLAVGHGLVLIAGPTGSGKSTTLFAALTELDRTRLNIVTLEDPIEYRVDGVTQVQVNRSIGHTFPGLLRHLLRQDPDVIMVGEIRDPETARIAIAAAVTGHLVLSTIHTIDAPAAVTRLRQMDVPDYMIAGGLSGVVAQRLVRRLCGRCGGRDPDCGACDDGYRGRMGVFQVLHVTPTLRDLIGEGAPPASFRAEAQRLGTRTLMEDAWRKIAEGQSTAQEVARVVPSD